MTQVPQRSITQESSCCAEGNVRLPACQLTSKLVQATSQRSVSAPAITLDREPLGASLELTAMPTGDDTPLAEPGQRQKQAYCRLSVATGIADASLAWLFGAVDPTQPHQAVLAKAGVALQAPRVRKLRRWLTHAQRPRSSPHNGPIVRVTGRELTPTGNGYGVGLSASAELVFRG